MMAQQDQCSLKNDEYEYCPEEIIHKKCKICGFILSVKPIYMKLDVPDCFVCGRCTPFSATNNSNSTFCIAEVYETVARDVKFPCSFKSEGCNAQLNFHDDVLKHESKCDYRMVACPLGCRRFEACQIESHFITQHTKMIKEIEAIFHVDQKVDVNKQQFFNMEGCIFVLTKESRARTNCWLTFRPLDPYSTLFASRKYMLQIKHESRTTAVITYARNLVTEMKTPIKIDFTDLRQVLGGNNFTYNIMLLSEGDIDNFHLKLTKKFAKEIRECIEEFICPICKNYFSGHILICAAGHSVCASCVKKLKKCPTCGASYSGARNYSLESIAERLSYPCYSRQCNFVGNPKAVRDHESNHCKFKHK